MIHGFFIEKCLFFFQKHVFFLEKRVFLETRFFSDDDNDDEDELHHFLCPYYVEIHLKANPHQTHIAFNLLSICQALIAQLVKGWTYILMYLPDMGSNPARSKCF